LRGRAATPGDATFEREISGLCSVSIAAFYKCWNISTPTLSHETHSPVSFL
jgi:hypothetical protein